MRILYVHMSILYASMYFSDTNTITYLFSDTIIHLGDLLMVFMTLYYHITKWNSLRGGIKFLYFSATTITSFNDTLIYLGDLSFIYR